MRMTHGWDDNYAMDGTSTWALNSGRRRRQANAARKQGCGHHWRGVRQLVSGSLGLTKTEVSGTNKGVVLGAGLEFNLHLIRVSPEIRYTRWGSANLGALTDVLRANQNQAEVLIGITF